MRKTLLQMYHDLKESGTTSDWPNLLANVMYKILLNKFKGVNSPWRQYTMQTDLADFKQHNRVIVSESPDLKEIAEDGEYEDTNLTDYNYGINLKTFGRKFTVGRQAIINDDLQALRQQPERFGRAAMRTLAKRVVLALEGDGVTYDGLSLFHNNHANKIGTEVTNDAAGMTALAAAMTLVTNSKDPDTNEKFGITPKYVVVPPEKEDTIMRLINGTAFVPVSTSGGTNDVGMVKRLTPLVEPFLTSTTKVYVFADPADLPVVEVGFLNGKQTPDLLVKRADTVSLAGGEDEWGYDFDEIFYKVRFDYAVARAMHQGVARCG